MPRTKRKASSAKRSTLSRSSRTDPLASLIRIAKQGPDAVCMHFGRSKVDLHTSLIEDGESLPSLKIRGSQRALRFLGLLCLAVSEAKDDESFFIEPDGPGCYHFSKMASHGLYLLRDRTTRRSQSVGR